MPNVYQPGLIQIRPQYEFDAEADNTPENVLWLQSSTTSAPSLAQLQSIQNVFDPGWAQVWKPWGHTTHFYQGSVITDWSSNTGLSFSSVGGFTAVAGSGTGSPAAPQVAALISYHVPIRYKGGHPRTYLPRGAMGEVTGTNNDELVSSCGAAILSAINALIGNLKSSGVLGGQTWSVYLHKNDPTKAHVMPFASFTVQTLLATQRRRLRHVGRK